MARRLRSRPTAWISAVVVVALTVVVGVLAVVAIDRSRPAPADESLAPIPTFGAVSPQPTSTPTPTIAPVTPVARAEERFLTVSSEGVLWRGIAGSCADGIAPLIERSADGGDSWNDVTPLYLGITQIARLDAFAGTQAQTVALYEDCAVDGLRTFTQGRFWESYEEVLATSAFIGGDDAGQVVTPDGAIGAPCTEARALRGDGDTVALICDAQAFALVDDEWEAFGIVGAVAVAVDGATVLVAHVSSDCAGLALSTVTDGATSAATCVEDTDVAAPTAIALADSSAFVWNGEAFITVPL
tara:strand:+ start:1431 stop:2330 length:900 start_codon:yes stop_codon:yes gene_type:complete